MAHTVAGWVGSNTIPDTPTDSGPRPSLPGVGIVAIVVQETPASLERDRPVGVPTRIRSGFDGSNAIRSWKKRVSSFGSAADVNVVARHVRPVSSVR